MKDERLEEFMTYKFVQNVFLGTRLVNEATGNIYEATKDLHYATGHTLSELDSIGQQSRGENLTGKILKRIRRKLVDVDSSDSE